MTMAEKAVHDLYEEVWKWKLLESPELSSFCGYHEYDDKWDDISEEAYKRREVCIQEFLEKAQSIDTSSCTWETKINYSTLVDDLKLYLQGTRFKSYLMPINYIEGIHNDCNLTISYMKFETDDDFYKYISRLEKLPKRIEQVISVLKRGVEEGVVMFSGSVNLIPSQLDKFVNTPWDELALFKPMTKKYTNIPEEKLEQFQTQAKHLISTGVYPALMRLKAYLEEEYFLHLRPKEGINCLENGDQWYQQCLDFHLSCSMTPQQVHDLGLKEVARIREQMLAIASKEGLGETFPEILAAIKKRQHKFFKTEEEVLDYVKNLCYNKIRPKLSNMFNGLPDIPMVIKPVPDFMKNAPAGFYLNGTPDGSREGSYCINTHNLDACIPFQLPALSLHEGEPGHHLQSIYTLGSCHLPQLRKFAEDSKYYLAPGKFALKTAYIEGWGLYSEGLGEEMNMYEDQLDLLGRYSYEIFRAARLVVDTGIHCFGWTRDQALAYMTNNSLASENGAAREVDRYITWPGQACAYKVGEIKIWELRRKAESMLGNRFNLKEFHHRILSCGSVPLHILERIVDNYISEKSLTNQQNSQ
ncbi:uncharacterized protein LOC131952915 [Physella acuta]|uniref:uncharacterized protein LOC131952915 n=1 Tax=Physella acuta TaxID=109671 RepID=UPI0027DD8116|nr:uncharacterized protein LOC131952915 [Physella acuta]XP_059171834.1 uncharacterized protein LOC131952915 [Physella acuta]